MSRTQKTDPPAETEAKKISVSRERDEIGMGSNWAENQHVMVMVGTAMVGSFFVSHYTSLGKSHCEENHLGMIAMSGRRLSKKLARSSGKSLFEEVNHRRQWVHFLHFLHFPVRKKSEFPRGDLMVSIRKMAMKSDRHEASAVSTGHQRAVDGFDGFFCCAYGCYCYYYHCCSRSYQVSLLSVI